jgi:hypothetical protein
MQRPRHPSKPAHHKHHLYPKEAVIHVGPGLYWALLFLTLQRMEPRRRPAFSTTSTLDKASPLSHSMGHEVHATGGSHDQEYRVLGRI